MPPTNSDTALKKPKTHSAESARPTTVSRMGMIKYAIVYLYLIFYLGIKEYPIGLYTPYFL